MFAKITKDHLFDGKTIQEDRTGVTLFTDGLPHEQASCMMVRLYDDDRELYYDAIVDSDAAMERLFDWGMKDSGVTSLDVLDEINNVWKVVMA